MGQDCAPHPMTLTHFPPPPRSVCLWLARAPMGDGSARGNALRAEGTERTGGTLQSFRVPAAGLGPVLLPHPCTNPTFVQHLRDVG